MISRRLYTAALAAAVLALPAEGLDAQYPTSPPPAAPLRAVHFPPFQEAKLANGVQLVLVANRKLPIVSISLTMPSGSVFDPPSELGLAGMTAELLTKGTKTRTADQIAEQIEGVGGSLNAAAGQDFFTVGTTVLADHVDVAFTLLSDVLLNATFPSSELELARKRELSALTLEMSDPGALAQRFYNKALYGDHPYGQRETEQTVQAITQQSVADFAHAHLKPGGSLLVIAGDLTLARAKALANKYLASWTGAAPEYEYPAPPPATATSILLVNRPGSAQSNILVGNLGLTANDPAWYPARVANQVLGGGADARLFAVLRQQKSWTYGAYSGLSRNRDVGSFTASVQVRTPVTDSALTELLHQLRRIRTEAIPDSELAAAKGNLVGSFPLTIETPQQIASQVSMVKRLSLPNDYLQRYRERLSAVTSAQAQQAARRVIHPDSAVIVVVGDGLKTYDGLKAIAPVRIVDPDGKALTPDDLKPSATAISYDVSQLAARRDSFQIVVQGNPVGAMVTAFATDSTGLVYNQHTALPAFGVNQQLQIAMDPTTLGIQSLDQSAMLGGQNLETHVTFANGRVKGQAAVPQGPAGPVKMVDVDTTFAAGTLEADQVQPLLAALPLAEGASFTLSVFEVDDQSVKPYTIKVEASDSVTVPAGTFVAYRVSETGGRAPLTFWISKDAPHRLLKMEIVGRPMAFELVK